MLFSCNDCDRTFQSQASLKQHQVATKHQNAISFPCNECNHVFQTKESLKQHQVAKHGPTHKCGFCDRSFGTRKGLEAHMDDQHPVQTSCPSCGIKRFRSFQAAIQHLESGACPDCRGKKNARDQVYRCISPHLGSSTRLLAAGDNHDDEHILEFPYVCPKCSRSFRQLNHLIQHQNAKHGDQALGHIGGRNFRQLGSS